MATLTITHDDDPDVVAEIDKMLFGAGATHVDATDPGRITATFNSDDDARTVAAPLAAARTIKAIEFGG